MKSGDKVELTEGVRFQIKPETDLDLDMGMSGIVVSKVNTHGFCRVQIGSYNNLHSVLRGKKCKEPPNAPRAGHIYHAYHGQEQVREEITKAITIHA